MYRFYFMKEDCMLYAHYIMPTTAVQLFMYKPSLTTREGIWEKRPVKTGKTRMKLGEGEQMRQSFQDGGNNVQLQPTLPREKENPQERGHQSYGDSRDCRYTGFGAPTTKPTSHRQIAKITLQSSKSMMSLATQGAPLWETHVAAAHSFETTSPQDHQHCVHGHGRKILCSNT